MNPSQVVLFFSATFAPMLAWAEDDYECRRKADDEYYEAYRTLVNDPIVRGSPSLYATEMQKLAFQKEARLTRCGLMNSAHGAPAPDTRAAPVQASTEVSPPAAPVKTESPVKVEIPTPPAAASSTASDSRDLYTAALEKIVAGLPEKGFDYPSCRDSALNTYRQNVQRIESLADILKANFDQRQQGVVLVDKKLWAHLNDCRDSFPKRVASTGR